MFSSKRLCLSVCCIFCLPLIADESGAEVEVEDKPEGSRVWTDSKTSRTLEGVLTDKHSAGKKIEIRKDKGGYVWLTIDQLIKKVHLRRPAYKRGPA